MPQFERNELHSQMQATQRRLWEDLREIGDVSKETYLIHLTGDASNISKWALFEMSLRRSMRRLRDASMPAGKVIKFSLLIRTFQN